MIAVTLESIAPVVVAVLGVGGIGGAVVAFIKVKPEANQIAVTASQGALIVQTGVIDTLHAELKAAEADKAQLRNRLEDLESKVALIQDCQAQVTELKRRVETLEDERTRLRSENTRLRKRVSELEKKLQELGHEAP